MEILWVVFTKQVQDPKTRNIHCLSSRRKCAKSFCQVICFLFPFLALLPTHWPPIKCKCAPTIHGAKFQWLALTNEREDQLLFLVRHLKQKVSLWAHRKSQAAKHRASKHSLPGWGGGGGVIHFEWCKQDVTTEEVWSFVFVCFFRGPCRLLVPRLKPSKKKVRKTGCYKKQPLIFTLPKKPTLTSPKRIRPVLSPCVIPYAHISNLAVKSVAPTDRKSLPLEPVHHITWCFFVCHV